MTPSLYEKQRLLDKLKPAAIEDIAASIAELTIHFPLAKMEPRIEAQFLANYYEDLAEFPAWAIDAACKKYRRLPDSQFFPKIGEMVKLCRDEISADSAALRAIGDQLRTQQTITHETKVVTPPEIEEIMKEFYANLQTDDPAAKPTFRTPDRAYFEGKAPQETPDTFTESHAEAAVQ